MENMHKLNCLLILLTLAMTPLHAYADPDSKAEANMAAQVSACSANSAMEWSSKLNRCVGKVAARATRNESKACNELTDVNAKEKCHLAIAEKSTGLSADTEKLNQGGTTGSMMLNGSIAAAYAIIALISEKGISGLTSGCTSKKILGVTSAAGLASDVYLKMSAKKKVKQLENKYALDKTSSAYEAQVKALEYLKEEQETVVKISSLEKKRNMALMAGYGAAAAFAVYEIAFPPASGPCNDPNKENDGKKLEGEKSPANTTAKADELGTGNATEQVDAAMKEASTKQTEAALDEASNAIKKAKETFQNAASKSVIP